MSKWSISQIHVEDDELYTECVWNRDLQVDSP